MVRLPPGWILHPYGQSGRGRSPQLRTIRRTDPRQYVVRLTGIPLQPAQAQALVPASGNVNLPSIGPTGLGNIWYPAQATVSTTTGVFDSSQFRLYLGSVNLPITLVGQCQGGAGTIAVALPPMQPGQYLIGVLTGGHPGDLVAMNVIGVMDALTT